MRTVVDFAAGHGELITAIWAEAPHLICIGVDVGPRPGGLATEVAWWQSPGGAQLPSQWHSLTDVLVIAHEWLDVVPCSVAGRDESGFWRDVHVDAQGRETLGSTVEAAALAWLNQWMPASVTRCEVGLTRDQAWDDLASGVQRGHLVAIDYGHEINSRPCAGTLIGYQGGVALPPRTDGSTDITAHVSVDSLSQDDRLQQTDALSALIPNYRAPSHALAKEAPTAYLRALAEHSAWIALRAPGGLGEFWWVHRSVGR